MTDDVVRRIAELGAAAKGRMVADRAHWSDPDVNELIDLAASLAPVDPMQRLLDAGWKHDDSGWHLSIGDVDLHWLSAANPPGRDARIYVYDDDPSRALAFASVLDSDEYLKPETQAVIGVADTWDDGLSYLDSYGRAVRDAVRVWRQKRDAT